VITKKYQKNNNTNKQTNKLITTTLGIKYNYEL